MSLKEKLTGLRKKLGKVSEIEKSEPRSLKTEVDKYIDDYRAELGNMDPSEAEKRVEALRNFIEKMAVWYEFKYSSYEIENGMYSELPLESDETYSIERFIESLTEVEKNFLKKPSYPSSVNILNGALSSYRIVLSKKGRVEGVEFATLIGNARLANSVRIRNCVAVGEIIGMQIESVVSLFESRGVKFGENDMITYTIADYEKEAARKEKLFDIVAYRIIERGGEFIGPRRALMFAKEFGGNIDVAMRYGIELYDPSIRGFIQDYARIGGNPELECYVGYFDSNRDIDSLHTMSIREILHSDDGYTDEEMELYQSLTNTFANLRDARIESNPDAYLNELRAWSEEFNATYDEKIQKRRIARGLIRSEARMKRL